MKSKLSILYVSNPIQYLFLVLLLAVGTVHKKIHLYLANMGHESEIYFCKLMTLQGHEDWVKDLAFTHFPSTISSRSHLMLASGSQDRYIRLWRIEEPNGENLQNNLWKSRELDGKLR